jgi:hypothetical protein
LALTDEYLHDKAQTSLGIKRRGGAGVEIKALVSGCDAELTVLALPHGKTWWTFGYEAFGTLDGVEHDLASTVALLNVRSPPRLPPGEAASYPAWFAAHTSFPVQ